MFIYLVIIMVIIFILHRKSKVRKITDRISLYF